MQIVITFRGRCGTITHRCHKKEFLLKFARDRWRWHWWLVEAKKRFGLRVLKYVVISMGRNVDYFSGNSHGESPEDFTGDVRKVKA